MVKQIVRHDYRSSFHPQSVLPYQERQKCLVCGLPEEAEPHWELVPDWQWLKSTTELQTLVYHYNYEMLRAAPIQLSQYLMWNMFAAFVEIAEASVEFSWKPWAMDEPFANRDRILEEVVDVNHFLGNILSVLGVTDAEYEAAYRAKQMKNTRRQASGRYSAKKGSLGEGSDLE